MDMVAELRRIADGIDGTGTADQLHQLADRLERDLPREAALHLARLCRDRVGDDFEELLTTAEGHALAIASSNLSDFVALSEGGGG